jgi:hypothetical protein
VTKIVYKRDVSARNQSASKITVNATRRGRDAAASAAASTVRTRRVEGVIFIILGKLILRT